MSWQIILSIILAVIAAPILTVTTWWKKNHHKDHEDRSLITAWQAGSIGTFGLIALLILGGMTTIVGTRQIGIETTFGRPTGKTYHNGLHFKAPWTKVAEFDGAIQIDRFDADGHRIKVRLGNNSTADADTSIRWQIKQGAADTLFVQYKTFDNVRVNLIERNLKAALNEQFQDFDPLAAKWQEGVPLQSFADKAAEHMRNLVGDQVEILDVTVTRLDYDERTEERIRDLNVERANTAIAEQAEKTAEAQRRANDKLADSVKNDPNVLVSKCLDIAKEIRVSPFGCWPGQSGMPLIQVPTP